MGALNHVNNDYHVDTFLDMQKDLAVWLKEPYDIDGEWTIAEKKRYLNRGCVAVAAATLTTTAPIVYEVKGTTALPVQELEIPTKMIQPMRVFIDGQDYKEVTFDQWLDTIGGFMELPSGSVASATGQYTVAYRGNRFFYWDQTKNVFQINPKITDTKTVEVYAVIMPNLLINDDDVSMLDPVFHHLVSAWAAWKMLPQDEEHKDRGREAQRDYVNGLRDFEKYKRKRRGNISKEIQLDQGQFSRSKDTLGRSDMGATWDRL